MRIANLRLFEQLDIGFEPGWNLIVGANGAGKTTILEAAYLLSHGRSFRAGSRDALVREGEPGFSIYGEFDGSASRSGLGIARQNGRVEARVNGMSTTLGDLMQHAAVLCFDPGSHDLLSGTSEGRRRFLDWGVFHVEHAFLDTWLRYQRALRQRNALLRRAASDAELEPWSVELARAGEPLSAMRQRYFSALVVAAEPLLAELLPELGAPRLEFGAGHDTRQPLLDELIARQSRDRERGHGTRGPHRADWSLAFERAPRREHLSRGQEKLGAFAMVMAQAMLYAASHSGMPVLCLDDLASEVDSEHLGRVLTMIERSRTQVLATATEQLAAFDRLSTRPAMFHVEQGGVRRQS